ncbi:hypothetical protein PVAP13_9NG430956 [Panicum virgatum]|uniref:Uncharacterized protein n=1 Tax=Panicum virgatum TaxID=38727 RepID=A0A8T0MNJ7_PANVG|nr:hypothetical protein PVAP13_9NG430956 [Panicum virgatum]
MNGKVGPRERTQQGSRSPPPAELRSSPAVTSLCGHRAKSFLDLHFSPQNRRLRLAARHLQLRSDPPASNCPFFPQCPRRRRLRSPESLWTRRGRARSAGCCPRARRCPTRTTSTTHSPSTYLTPPSPGARRLLPPPYRLPSRSRSRATAAASPASCSAPLPRLLPAARPPRHPPPRTPLPPPPPCPCPPRRRALRSPLRLLLSISSTRRLWPTAAGVAPARGAARGDASRWQWASWETSARRSALPAARVTAPDVCSASWAPCRRAASATPASARR